MTKKDDLHILFSSYQAHIKKAPPSEFSTIMERLEQPQQFSFWKPLMAFSIILSCTFFIYQRNQISLQRDMASLVLVEDYLVWDEDLDDSEDFY